MQERSRLPITALVMTKNEDKNLEACLSSICEFVEKIILIDSSSTDNTLNIAQKYNCEIYNFDSPFQSKLMQWALKNCKIDTEWIVRVDADERWTEKGFEELAIHIQKKDVNGLYISRKVFFMQKWLRYGGMYVNGFLVVFRKGTATMEDKIMDEHFKVEGKVINTNIDIIEANYDRQENIGLWTEKHNRYSTREAISFLTRKYNLDKQGNNIGNFFGSRIERKRWFKEHFFYKMPYFIRPFLYFIFRFFIQLAFLDGTPGFIHAILQAFWYRLLVDTKIYQIEKLAKTEHESIENIILKHYNYKF